MDRFKCLVILTGRRALLSECGSEFNVCAKPRMRDRFMVSCGWCRCSPWWSSLFASTTVRYLFSVMGKFRIVLRLQWGSDSDVSLRVRFGLTFTILWGWQERYTDGSGAEYRARVRVKCLWMHMGRIAVWLQCESGSHARVRAILSDKCRVSFGVCWCWLWGISPRGQTWVRVRGSVRCMGRIGLCLHLGLGCDVRESAL